MGNHTKSPLHAKVQRQVENIEKTPAADRDPMSEEFCTLAMCQIEDQQIAERWRSGMKTEIVTLRTAVGEVHTKQSEILNGINEIRGQRNGDGNGSVITIKSNMIKRLRNNWMIILFAIFASGGSVATFIKFFMGNQP